MSDTPKFTSNEPSVRHASITLLGLAAWISFGIFGLESDLHGVLLLGLVWVVLCTLPLKVPYSKVQDAMRAGVERALPALYIFLMIGVVIATFIQSGTIGTLIYYGLKFMHPAIFLPAGLILCSIMSLAVGTSWGTVATGGIVLIGIGEAMGIPLPIVAGMIISGASFGDKMSPVSDTTNLAALSSDVNLYAHIKSMLFSTVPSYIITLAVFSYVGSSFAGQALPEAELNALINGLDSNFVIGIFMLLPMLILLILSARGLSADATMLISALVAVIIAIFVQGYGLSEIITGFYEGAKIETGVEALNPLLNRGGIIEMSWSFTLSVIAISLGSVLQHMGFLRVVMASLLKNVHRAASIVTASILTNFASNATLGDSYIAMILTGQMFKDKYDKAGIDRTVLSRSLEEGGTLTTALVPWTSTGAYFAATLGVATLEYAPWALLNWINPLIGIIFAWFGIALFRSKVSLVEKRA